MQQIIMQGVKLCEHGWKLVEFDDTYTTQHVIGTYDTIEHAIQPCYNTISPLYTVKPKKINGYQCLLLRYQHRYFGAIYISDKLIYLDPNPASTFSLLRVEWRTEKEVIQQLHDFIALIKVYSCIPN